MPEFDRRSPDSFKSLENAEITEIAWVGLRMNVDYQRDYEAIIANSSDGGVTEAFRSQFLVRNSENRRERLFL